MNCAERDPTTGECTKLGVPLRWMFSNCIYIQINSLGSDDVKDGSDIEAAE
jgi:hypothetical protein